MNICEHLFITAKLFPDKEAVVFEGQRFTYSQIASMASAAAQQLSDAGIEHGDRVALMLPNVPAFIVWYYAALKIGAIAVSISTRLVASEVAFLVSDCEANAFIALEETFSACKGELPDCVIAKFVVSENGKVKSENSTDVANAAFVKTEPDEAALILYTSGTTGFAKGATLSHSNVRSNVHAFNHLCNMQPADRILIAVPMFHCFGQNALLNSAFNVGATIVLQQRFDPIETRELIKNEAITQLYGVPMMFQLLHETCMPDDLGSITYCFSAAATLPIQTATRWREKFGLPINEGYGLTETSPFASYNHRIKFVPGSIGTPIDNVEMKIVDTQTGDECSVGELGEIAIRGPNVMLGYWNRDEDTAKAIRNGWFHSGDIGRQDENGYFFIVDRVKDMISVGGQKVFPAEVERVLLHDTAVAQIAVVGLPDEVFGEQVVAFVVAAKEISDTAQVANELRERASQNLAGYKVPRDFIFVDELPRNPSGKILKRKLREHDFVNKLSQSSAGSVDSNEKAPVAGSDASGSKYLPQLRTQLQSAFPSNRKHVANQFVTDLVRSLTESDKAISPETRFLDAGLDSMMIVEMSSTIQSELGTKVEVPATLVFDHPQIGDLSDFLLASIYGDEDDAELQSDPATMNPVRPAKQTNSADSLDEINAMSEEQALDALMKELEA